MSVSGIETLLLCIKGFKGAYASMASISFNMKFITIINRRWKFSEKWRMKIIVFEDDNYSYGI